MASIGKTTSGKEVPQGLDAIYHQEVMVAEVGTTLPLVEVRSNPKYMRKVFRGWTKADHLEAAELHARHRDALYKRFNRAYQAAGDKYGYPTDPIRDGESPTFPAKVQAKMRVQADAVYAEDGASRVHYLASAENLMNYPFRPR